ncbi:MAG: hypothetical protein LBU32_29040 [Clostridiales bacterium]|nr:hypothetical protein [Clostridiales bacterium]
MKKSLSVVLLALFLISLACVSSLAGDGKGIAGSRALDDQALADMLAADMMGFEIGSEHVEYMNEERITVDSIKFVKILDRVDFGEDRLDVEGVIGFEEGRHGYSYAADFKASFILEEGGWRKESIGIAAISYLIPLANPAETIRFHLERID